MLQSAKLKGIGYLKSVLISGMQMQSLEFPQLAFGLAVVHYFLTMFQSLCFGIVMYILCHYVLEICNLIFDFNFTGDYS